MANINFAKKTIDNSTDNIPVHKILIVDDDQSIHDVTDIAINAMEFLDFKLQIFSAFSAKEAKEILHNEKDIALALIDVVMETPEAGLDLVQYIRHDLKNKTIRLIIRTGQANDFPQMQVIQHYDINDFKEKTELTIERLFTTIRSSVKQYEQLLELQNKFEDTYKQLTTNALTMLPNRIKLIEDFSNQSNHTLILLDIVGFSGINDANGYVVGDFVLKELAGFLSSMYSRDFKVYHLNNDLFALVTLEENLDNIIEIVENIKKDISQLHIVTNNFNKTIQTTIGVAHQTDTDIVRKAELALKEARSTGKNQIKYYSSDLKIIQQISNTNKWAPIIQHALEHDELISYAQPIHNTKDNTIDKYELLVRLKHKETIYAPLDFLPAAEHSGNLYNIFKFMFKEGCRLSSRTGNRYSINIGDSDFNNEGLLPYIESTLREYNVDPTLLSLEVLEYNAITRSKEMKEKVMKIHTLGIEFVVDDFGVQCSNFAQTEFLPITTLKIDGSFIKNLPESRDSQIVVKTIQTFAREKGLKLVAEFVCDEKVYNKVKELGIEFVQGYYLGEPIATT
ncbi:EAL domain-containing protein [Sulfurimonas sp. SAG-AH-194-C21]|nr:EAL domain-containing protein [Sulfurimonas sp. SAG-AH-194-C21]MDF1883313.1 EAL domain-containing protein [Sulfurimonas sp. SAG-AH-194-C21]